MALLGMWRDKHWEIETKLSTQDAVERLRARVQPKRDRARISDVGKDPGPPYLILGEVSEQRVQLAAVRRYIFHSWRSTFRGKFVGSANGTVLRGSVGYPRWLKIFAALHLSAVAVPSLAAAVSGPVVLVTGNRDVGGHLLVAAGVTAVLFMFFSVIWAAGTSMGRADEAHLLKWIEHELIS